MNFLRSVLSRIVSYPRNRYALLDLDLAFITEDIIVMSLPSSTFIQSLYRNELHKVKLFLDKTPNYRVFDLRAEGAGYEDSAFDGKVSHFPFVDHHPPPFALLPSITNAIDGHLSRPGALAVIHCKAGKGRSGLSVCSYLIAYRGWSIEDALRNFTKKRMRPGFGEGVSIPSQRRYLNYVAQWTAMDKKYSPTMVEITRLVVRNLREGFSIAVRELQDEGRRITTIHEFSPSEISTVDGETIIVPKVPIRINSDICIYISQGHAWAHFWFNASFERDKKFSIAWEEVDGWRGTRIRMQKAFDSIMVHWVII